MQLEVESCSPIGIHLTLKFIQVHTFVERGEDLSHESLIHADVRNCSAGKLLYAGCNSICSVVIVLNGVLSI